MAFDNRKSVPTGDTEEIFLDEEEFEALLAAEQSYNAGVSGAKGFSDDFVDDNFEVKFDDGELELEAGDVDDTVMYSPVSGDIDGYDGEYESGEYDGEYESEEYDEYDSDGESPSSDDGFEYDEDEEDVVNIFKGDLTKKLTYIMGGLIAVFAIIIGVIFLVRKPQNDTAGPNMGELGNNILLLNVIGEEGINNVFGREAARLTDLYEASENFQYSEVDEETGLINVNLALTSILKDLKIKFVNKHNKLVANVPFQAEVTDDKGVSKIYTDEDKDGIIYLENMAGGKYTVRMVSLDGFENMYCFNDTKESIDVKSQISYAKVDVSNEIKSESQVDVKKEDTKVSETVVEAKLEDTVEYVMSAKVPLTDESGFAEVPKNKIPDPIAQYTEKGASGNTYFKKLDSDVSGGEVPTYSVNGITVPTSINAGDEVEATVSVTGSYSSIVWSGTNDAAFTVTQDAGDPTKAKIKAANVASAATGKVKVSVTFADSTGGSAEVDITVNPVTDNSSLSIEGSAGTLYPGSTFDIPGNCTIVAKDKTGSAISQYTLTYASSDTKIATVDNNGLIKAVAKGTATITVTCSATNMTTKSVSFSIEVSESKITVALNVAKKTVFVGDKETVTLVATVTGTSKDSSVIWTSSDENVVTVSDKGVLTPLREGKATITCASKEYKNAKAVCEVTVILHPSKNTVSLLKDADGNQLYVYDAAGKKYVEAKYADYYTGAKLYKPSEVKYKLMGWWTINGKTYYYDKNGKAVTGEQVILGTKYNFASDGSLVSSNGTFGIDVSKWNGTIDWNSVAKSGVSFAIIRSGFRGSTAGGLIEDAKFTTNIKNATAAGIKVGVYFFTQATNEVEAIEEASMVLGQISGYKISYPIFLDVESAGAGARAENLSAAQRTAVIKAFCQTITNSGYTAGVYANKTWFNSKINTSRLTAYKIWLAQYNSTVTYTTTRYDLWQYSSKGSLSGISGDVDFNLSYLGY